MNLYELQDIAYDYGGSTVLSLDHWRIPPNLIQGLAGPNGSGKTTLLKLLGFIEKPTRGRLLFNGRPAEPFSPEVRNKVACLPQDSFLLRRSVFRNVVYGLDIRKDLRDREARARQALEWVGLDPDRFKDRSWYALSGGEARRVALAARLVLEPQVLLLDEPTSSVDEASSQMILEAILKAHRRWNTSLIIASHDLQWLQSVCDDVHYLFRGQLAGTGRPTFIFGPWTVSNKGHVFKNLAEGQAFKAGPAPKDSNHAAVSIPVRKLHLYAAREQVPAGLHPLQGTLIQLGYDKHSRGLYAQVVVGTTTFSVQLPGEPASIQDYTPGRQVVIAYDPDQVRWHG
ncbi:MAG: ABC transporter ATP-binding protein [Desulfosarcinaceae bacterium]